MPLARLLTQTPKKIKITDNFRSEVYSPQKHSIIVQLLWDFFGVPTVFHSVFVFWFFVI